MRDRPKCWMLVLVLCLQNGCAALAVPVLPPIATHWTREQMSTGKSQCKSSRCRATIHTRNGDIEVATQVREYKRHQIPGWDSGSTAGRVASSIMSGIMRRQGLTTDRVTYGLGTRVSSDTNAGGWQLRCKLLWVDEQEVEYNKDDHDHVTRTTRQTEGKDCRLVAASDTGVVRWRFRAGIAPSRDSLALVYDSLRAQHSPAVSASPPMSLERLADAGAPNALYHVTGGLGSTSFMERMAGVGRVDIEREGGVAIAMLHTGLQPALDISPEASAEEARVARLLAAALMVSIEEP